MLGHGGSLKTWSKCRGRKGVKFQQLKLHHNRTVTGSQVDGKKSHKKCFKLNTRNEPWWYSKKPLKLWGHTKSNHFYLFSEHSHFVGKKITKKKICFWISLVVSIKKRGNYTCCCVWRWSTTLPCERLWLKMERKRHRHSTFGGGNEERKEDFGKHSGNTIGASW